MKKNDTKGCYAAATAMSPRSCYARGATEHHEIDRQAAPILALHCYGKTATDRHLRSRSVALSTLGEATLLRRRRFASEKGRRLSAETCLRADAGGGGDRSYGLRRAAAPGAGAMAANFQGPGKRPSGRAMLTEEYHERLDFFGVNKTVNSERQVNAEAAP